MSAKSTDREGKLETRTQNVTQPIHNTNMSGDLGARIRDIAQGRDTLEVARFQFIGIEQIRSHYGADWPEKKSRVQVVARHFIARRTAPNDLIIPAADGFLVVFASQTGVAATLAAGKICDGLNRFFLGSPDEVDGIRFEHVQTEVKAVDLARFASEEDQGLGDHSPKPLPPNTALERFSIRYQPVWDASRERLSAYYLTPTNLETGLRAPGYQFEMDEPSPENLLLLDEAQLRASESALKALFESGRKAMIGTTISVQSLSGSAGLTRIFSTMSSFDPALARFRIIRIAGITPGYPRIYLEDILRNLRTRVSHITFSLHWAETDLASILALKPSAVGFTLNKRAPGGLGRPSQLRAHVRAAIQASHETRIPFFLHGDLTRPLARQFLSDGVKLMSSSAIWPRRPAPGAIEPWTADLLAEPVEIAAQ